MRGTTSFTIKTHQFNPDSIRIFLEDDKEVLAQVIAYCKHDDPSLSDEDARKLAILTAQNVCKGTWERQMYDEHYPYDEPSVWIAYNEFSNDVKKGKIFATDNSYYEKRLKEAQKKAKRRKFIKGFLIVSVMLIILFIYFNAK